MAWETAEETKIRKIKRDIDRFKEEISELKLDSMKVRNECVKDFIAKEIDSRNRLIERREFQLWKLSK